MDKIILFALDVLTNSQHRESHRTNGDWAAYEEAFSDDEANQSIVELVNVLSEYYSVFVYSDMNETHRQTIMDWLVDVGVNAEEVLLSNVRGSIVNKKLDAVSEVLEEVEFCWESNLMVCEHLREKGVVVFECLI